ncbi:MAG: VaFE repeat-containing surface-anchored protein [Lachnospiraceae bacterium]|nr:VaFE repeat-containing surface-anchored protein [Lachnospiraceae bacterium]
MNNVKCKRKIAVFIALLLLFFNAFLLKSEVFSNAQEDTETSSYEENNDMTETSEDISLIDESTEIISIDNIELVGSGDYGTELNKQGTLIGVNTYIDGTLQSSFNESILRFQTSPVYCYDLNKRFKQTDNYTYIPRRPDIFNQDDQDTIALIVYYFDSVIDSLDDRPAVQYYYIQCCIWNYIHSTNPGYNQYTVYIQPSECNRSNEEQQAIFDACMTWVNENKNNYTTDMQYWINNDGDYQPVLHTNVFPKPQKGHISVVKTSSNTTYTNGNNNYSLQGAVYTVYPTEADANAGTNAVTTITTDAEGKGTSSELDIGTYWVKETTASKGYKLDSGVYKAEIYLAGETITSATVSSIEAMNYARICVVKTSSNTAFTNNNSNYSLQGATYGVYKTKSDAETEENAVTNIITNNEGKGESIDLVYGTYYVKEIKASKGYNIDSNIYAVSVNDTVKISTISSSEKPKSGKINIIKYSADTSITYNNICYSLNGAVYGVYSSKSDAASDQNRVTSIVTDSDGKGESTELAYGMYFVKEIQASKGYAVDSNIYEAKINEAVSTASVCSTEIPNGNPVDITLIKRDSENNEAIEGAIFEIKYYAAETENNINDSTYRRHWYLKTDTNGEIRLNSKYLTDYNGKSSDSFYYNKDKKPVYPLGYITIEEIQAPAEYIKDTDKRIYKVEADRLTEKNSNKAVIPQINEHPVKQAFQLIKLAEDGTSNDLKPLANAGFMAWRVSDLPKDKAGNYIFDATKAIMLSSDGSKEMFTDNDGYALSAELRYGTYIVRETTVPDGYIPVTDFTVSVTKDSRTPQELIYKTDTQKKYYLRITKVDSITKQAVIDNTSSYKIWSYADNKYISFRTYTGSDYEEVDEFTTGMDGVLLTPGTLAYGDYRLEEITSPYGYNLDTPKGINFSINKNSFYVTTENAGEMIAICDIIYEDTPVLAQFSLAKSGEIREFDEASEEFITNIVPLADIDFGIYAAEEIYAADGSETVIFSEGELAYTITTDEEGKASQDNIPLGKYVVKELDTPDDFIKADDIIVEFKLEDKKTNEEGVYYVEQSIDLINKSYYPKVKTTASDKVTNEHTGIISKKAQIIDNVELEDLVIGRTYVLKGKIYDTDSGEPLLDDNDNEVTEEMEFTSDSNNMTVNLEFYLDSTALKGKNITVFEDLYYNNEKVAMHADINDTEQQVHYPELHTNLKSADDEEKLIYPEELIKLTDTVDIANVCAGDKFILIGVIYDKAAGDKLILDGREVTGYSEFIAQDNELSMDVEFELNALSLEGKDIVCFEYLYLIDDNDNAILVAEHTDINNEGQTIRFMPLVREEISTPDESVSPPDTPTSPYEPPTEVIPPSPSTGDNSALPIVVISFLLSMSIIIRTIIIKKIKNNQ